MNCEHSKGPEVSKQAARQYTALSEVSKQAVRQYTALPEVSKQAIKTVFLRWINNPATNALNKIQFICKC